MSLIGPLELLLVNLENDISPEYVFLYVGKEAALRRLREETGQDFGYDTQAWRRWLEERGLVPKT